MRQAKRRMLRLLIWADPRLDNRHPSEDRNGTCFPRSTFVMSSSSPTLLPVCRSRRISRVLYLPGTSGNPSLCSNHR